MKTECSVVRDLLPLYVEDMVSEETAAYIGEHLETCEECKAELESLKGSAEIAVIEEKPAMRADNAKPFKKIMKKMNRQFYSVAYAALIFLIFLGFGWTGGENLMYNSLIMPVVGVFGYYVFRWKAIYKVPILLLIIDLLVYLLQLVEIGLGDTLAWTFIYCIFVVVGIAIAFLLHFALRKEKN
ncbi:MAG: zf-HC2 domain-containing protein [Clostridia bacterium]|nr:zf-HC2 domain-containing protein [Clostridia bacterium]